MERDILRKVQLVQLEMLKELDRICKELHISYFLDSGTLLGAIRHNGFIPWDDDLDVGMLRKDYESFLEKAPAVLDKKYYLQDWKRDPGYGNTFAKLRKNNTVFQEAAAENSKAHNGLYIDIFPYDTYPDDSKKRKKQGNTYDFIRRCILVKCGYKPWIMCVSPAKAVIKHLGYAPMIAYAACHSKQAMIEKFEEECTAYNHENSGYLYEQCGAANYGDKVISVACLGNLTEHIFEDGVFPVPEDSDAYLRSIYGDYMQLPPEDQRENRHNIIAVNFGD